MIAGGRLRFGFARCAREIGNGNLDECVDYHGKDKFAPVYGIAGSGDNQEVRVCVAYLCVWLCVFCRCYIHSG